MAEKTLNEVQIDIEVLKEKVSLLLDAAKQYRELTKEAIDKADADMNRRLEGMNEFRAQLDRQAGTFITSKEIEALKSGMEIALKQLLEKNDLALTNLNDKLFSMTSANLKRIEELEKSKNNMDGRLWVIGVVWALILILFSWYLNHD